MILSCPTGAPKFFIILLRRYAKVSVTGNTHHKLQNFKKYKVVFRFRKVLSVHVEKDIESNIAYVSMKDPTASEIVFVRSACPSKQVLKIACAELGKFLRKSEYLIELNIRTNLIFIYSYRMWCSGYAHVLQRPFKDVYPWRLALACVPLQR